MRLLLVFAAIVCVHWNYAAVVPLPVDTVDIVAPAGQCPVYKFRCLIACPLISVADPCANKGSNCCTSDCQCKRKQKCCQPICGCNKVCTNVTSIIPIPTPIILNA